MSYSQDSDTTDDWSGFCPLPSQDLLTQYTDEAVQAAANALRHLDNTMQTASTTSIWSHAHIHLRMVQKMTTDTTVLSLLSCYLKCTKYW